MGPTIDRDSSPKIDEWLSAIEGSETPQASDGRDVTCDYCNETVEPNTPVTNYLANKLVNTEYAPTGEEGRFYFLRVYCSDCDRQSLQYPCRGYTELLLAGYIDEQHRLRDLSIVDASLGSSGIPYDPEEVWEVTHPGMSFAEFNAVSMQFSSDGTPVAMGPADIIDDLIHHDIEPSDVFTVEGDIIADEDEIQEKMSESPF